MRPLKNSYREKPAKDQRERLLLLGLVELYLETGKPIGSNTLRENGFEALSSATIRNYFSKLEDLGYLKQQHSSGGRVPTPLAYKLYADTYIQAGSSPNFNKEGLKKTLFTETRQITKYLSSAAEIIAESTKCAVFLSAPRFDQDFVLDIKLVRIDNSRCLCILITDFGLVHTESLYTDKKLSNFSIKRIETYLHWRLTGMNKPEISAEEEFLGSKFYTEIMLRHIVNYTHFSAEDIYKTGFSKLLNYPDFNDASALANGLSLFENPTTLRLILNECSLKNELCCWIGDDLHKLAPNTSACSVIAVPYRIHQSNVGAIAILGPNRIPYKELFNILQTAQEYISETLTKSLYKFKISYRSPETSSLSNQQTPSFQGKTSCLLLEDKS